MKTNSREHGGAPDGTRHFDHIIGERTDAVESRSGSMGDDGDRSITLPWEAMSIDCEPGCVRPLIHARYRATFGEHVHGSHDRVKFTASHKRCEFRTTHAKSLRLMGRDEPVLLAKNGFKSIEERTGGFGHEQIPTDFVTPRGVAKSVAILETSHERALSACLPTLMSASGITDTGEHAASIGGECATDGTRRVGIATLGPERKATGETANSPSPADNRSGNTCATRYGLNARSGTVE